MEDVFDVLVEDHEEIRQALAELEKGPTAATGATEDQLMLRKIMTEELITEQAKHAEFERLLSAFTQAAREHFDFEERQVWPRLRAAFNSGALTAKAAAELGHKILQARQAVPAPPFPRESASSS